MNTKVDINYFEETTRQMAQLVLNELAGLRECCPDGSNTIGMFTLLNETLRNTEQLANRLNVDSLQDRIVDCHERSARAHEWAEALAMRSKNARDRSNAALERSRKINQERYVA